MTKNELKAEIEKLQKAYGLRYYSGINSMKKAELESFLNDIKYAHSLKCSTEAETVETKVENTENTVEVEKNDNNGKNMTKNEIINKINKFMGNVDYFHYFKFVNGENKTKTTLNCVLIGDDGIMYYRHFGDCDRINFKKLKNCTKAELIAIDSVCKLYIDHMNSKLSKVA